jgi:hypothetical protein
MLVKQGQGQIALTVLSISNKIEKISILHYSDSLTEPVKPSQADPKPQEMTTAERAQVIRLLESVLTNLI